MQHIHTTTAHPHYCQAHDREFYPHTCGHGTGCIDCDLERAVEAARAGLPEAVNGRLEKAVELVRAGNVYVNGTRAAVKSQSSERIYEIRAAGCQCEDAHYQAPTFAGVPACKHQVGVWLKLKMEQQVSSPPAAPVRSQPQTTNASNDSTFVVKSRTIRSGRQQPDVIEGTFERKGDAEQFADELARDIREEWPATLRRLNGHYKLTRGETCQFIWAEAVA